MSTTRDGRLRAAVIGASAAGGWARESHVVALQELPGYELAAVATRDQESADEAARAFGAERGYGAAADLFADASIDIVVVGVRVPAHRELVLGAVAAGKHVVCEWPLGRDVAEAEELRDAAADAGVHGVIGLQSRMSPAVRRTRQLVASGAIGRVLSARLYDSTVAFGPATTKSDAYLEDPANGATHVAIHGGHSLDLVAFLLGELTAATVLESTQYPRVSVEQGDALERLVADHLLVAARTASGAPVSVEVAGGRPAEDTPFRLDVTGSEGRVSLVGGAIRGFQSGRLALLLDGEPQPVDDPATTDLADTAVNVAGLYTALQQDLRDATATATAPGFDDAVHLTRVLADLAPGHPSRPRT